MAVVEAKSQELQGMSAVGVDIESVKNQLEEHKVRDPPLLRTFMDQSLHIVCNWFVKVNLQCLVGGLLKSQSPMSSWGFVKINLHCLVGDILCY